MVRNPRLIEILWQCLRHRLAGRCASGFFVCTMFLGQWEHDVVVAHLFIHGKHVWCVMFGWVSGGMSHIKILDLGPTHVVASDQPTTPLVAIGGSVGWLLVTTCVVLPGNGFVVVSQSGRMEPLWRQHPFFSSSTMPICRNVGESYNIATHAHNANESINTLSAHA